MQLKRFNEGLVARKAGVRDRGAGIRVRGGLIGERIIAVIIVRLLRLIARNEKWGNQGLMTRGL